jgi:hypothetical protein
MTAYTLLFEANISGASISGSSFNEICFWGPKYDVFVSTCVSSFSFGISELVFGFGCMTLYFGVWTSIWASGFAFRLYGPVCRVSGLVCYVRSTSKENCFQDRLYSYFVGLDLRFSRIHFYRHECLKISCYILAYASVALLVMICVTLCSSTLLQSDITSMAKGPTPSYSSNMLTNSEYCHNP